MDNLIPVLLLLAAAWLLWMAPRRVVVAEPERALLYVNGRFRRLLEPGAHWHAARRSRIVKIDMRRRYLTIPGQEVLTADSVGLKMTLVAQFEVADPVAALHGVESYAQALYLEVQLALREVVAATPADELLEQSPRIGSRLREIAAPKAEPFGLRLLSAEVKDVMFAGDLKRAFAQVVLARKEGQAALERARGETAALRSLANAARMVEENPALLQLRLLQVVGESSGNTIIADPSSVFRLAPNRGRSDRNDPVPSNRPETTDPEPGE